MGASPQVIRLPVASDATSAWWKPGPAHGAKGSAHPRVGPLAVVQRLCLAILHLVVGLVSLAGRLGSSVPSPWANHSGQQGPRKAVPAPRTVALVMTHPDATPEGLRQLADVLLWCCEVNIERIVIHEPEAVLADLIEDLKSLISGVAGSTTVEPHVAGGATFSISTGTGPTASQVFLSSAASAIYPYVEAARNWELSLDGSRPAGSLPGKDGRERLRELLSHFGGAVAVMEPELVLVFGPVLTLAGYPPWALRLSEIHAMGHIKDATRRRLTDSLTRYCRTEQRFGK